MLSVNTRPTISVVMSVYNGEQYLGEAVNSILNQVYEDFELLIIDDGSTDNTSAILNDLSDPRIRIIDNGENRGLTYSLIKGCDAARGKYIARMDADDVSYPLRFQKQVEFLESHLGYATVGTQCHYLDDKGKPRRSSNYCTTDEEIGSAIWNGSPFAHGSTMTVRRCLDECGGYREIFRYSQDCDLWLRLKEKHKMANLPDVLYGLRYHRASVSLSHLYLQTKFADLAREFARMRAECGSDPLMSEDGEEVRSRIASWNPNGVLERMRIRSESAVTLMDFMIPWARVSDIIVLWLTALCNNPLNAGAWKILFTNSLRVRAKGVLSNRL